MADRINLLPETVANQIAAGEVVQRPSSVIKELLENAVDAGANRITLLVKDGGSLLIQVVDNGTGMSHTDARMCWERHATSKIRKADDLYCIKTFGFRGEALASIASVAMVEMDTKMKENDTGTRVLIEGGHIKKHEFVAAPNGTKIAVKNLFYNIPARRNFLKSITVETRHIIDEFNRAALAHPEISFSFFNNDKEVFDLPATDAKNRIISVLGKIKHSDLLELNESTDIVKVKGFVGKPEVAKKSRGEQYLYVNSRFVKDAYLNHAIKSAFQNLVSSDSFPTYVISLEIDPARIDVNVHPQKTEIKFEDEKALYSIVNATIKKALGSFVMVPELDNDSVSHIFKTNPILPRGDYNPNPKTNPRYNPFQAEQNNKTRSALGWERIYQPLGIDPNDKPLAIPEKEKQVDMFKKNTPQLNVDAVFQFEDILIVKAHGELYLVNTLLARERIWYERYLANFEKHRASTQQLLFPKTIEFSAGDANILSSILEEVRAIGFDIGDFGKNTFIVNGLPADLPKGTEQQLIEGLLENYKENRTKYSLNEKENLARSMAKNAAMFANKLLSPNEQNALAVELFSCNFPRYCPFGRPVYVNLPREELNKLFKI